MMRTDLLEYHIYASPCTNNVALLDEMVSPEVVTTHWMVVPLYSTGILLKAKIPKIFKTVVLIPSVWLRSSSRVPLTNHWNCCIAPLSME